MTSIPKFSVGSVVKYNGLWSPKAVFCNGDLLLGEPLEVVAISEIINPHSTHLFSYTVIAKHPVLCLASFNNGDGLGVAHTCSHISEFSRSPFFDQLTFREGLNSTRIPRAGMLGEGYLDLYTSGVSTTTPESQKDIYCTCPAPIISISFTGLGGNGTSFNYCKKCKKERL